MPTLRTDETRSVLEISRSLRHPVARVWQAITEQEHLAAWFPTPASPELRVGGVIGFGPHDAGTVTDLDPPRVFAFTWGGDHLRFELHPEGDGTRLLLIHTFDDHVGAASFASGWEGSFAALALMLDGRRGEDTGIDLVALHERYVRELGLDVPVVTDGVARLERQLTRPDDDVWRALGTLAGPGAVREGAVLDDGELRWELGAGTGHGARLVVTDAKGRGEVVAEKVAALVARLA